MDFIKQNITISTNLIQDIQRELQIQSKDLIISEENVRLTSTNSIMMNSSVGGGKAYDLNEATRQVVTMAINLKDGASLTNTADYMQRDINWYFITQNCFNNYFIGLLSSSGAYV